MSGPLDDVPLVDQHCHSVWPGVLTRAQFERGISESADPARPGTTAFDSQLGVAVRRWCAPVLDLPPHAPPDQYVGRRAELGTVEVHRRLLAGANVVAVLVDTGFRGGELVDLVQLGALADAPAHEIVRLEAVAERLVSDGVGATEFVSAYPGALEEASRAAVALKSVIGYRFGLDVAAHRPSRHEVLAAADRWCRSASSGHLRLDEPVLLQFVLWCGVERGLPLQFHVGLGDPDLTLHRTDPSLLTPFIRAVQPLDRPVVLLHNYPYHRHAAYLAHVFPHVYVDVGLAVNYTGARAAAVLAEALEVAPFHKLLYSSDAYGLAELHYLGAVLWRRAIDDVLTGFVTRGDWASVDATRVARMVGADNATHLYSL